MAKRRVHEIAKEQGIASKDLLAKLRAAGVEVKAAASSVEESVALAALGDGTAAKAPAKAKPKPAAKAKPAAKPKAKPPVKAKAPAKAAVAEPAAPSAAQTAPEAQAPAAAASDTGATPAAAKPVKPVKPPPLEPHPDRPAPGQGPRVVSVPPPAPKPSSPDAGTNKQRPQRPRVAGEPAAGAGGRRRVVIDSQASRRQSGPGGGPQNSPPRRQRRGRRRRGTYEEPTPREAVVVDDTIRVNSGSTVKDVAEYLGVPIPEVIKKFMQLGQMATLTQTLSDEAIEILGVEFDRKIEVVHAADDVDTDPVYDDEEADLAERPPVVTIMGHVDHGKTSLLDAIRETEVAAGEAGGITQHIGAYQVRHADKLITFLDTPGHEAFTAMRARGAKVTDIAVIVVAADDGVKPQTQEAIDHAKAAEVPIVVAVNKIDKEGAQPDRVRTEMTQHDLQPVEWGGETEFVDVSAKTREGLETLLETLQVVAELEELKANPGAEASGVVIESKLDAGRGAVATILVQRGTLKVGDALVAGAHWARVRAMNDFHGTKAKRAVPGDPIEVLGFDGVPEAGEFVRVVENERKARSLAGERANRLKTEALARRSGAKVSLEDVLRLAREGTLKELNLVLKADVSGSLEAVEDEIARLPQDEVSVNVIHRGVGGINESDVMLASASNGVILGFNVRPVGDARPLASHEGVEIRSYTVIYKAIEDLRAAMEGMLEPEEVEDALADIEVRQTFRASKVGTIAGCYVTDGKVTRGAKVRLVRDGTVIYDGEIGSLRRFNEDVREVASGFECGIVLHNFADVKEGDLLEVYATRKVERQLA